MLFMQLYKAADGDGAQSICEGLMHILMHILTCNYCGSAVVIHESSNTLVIQSWEFMVHYSGCQQCIQLRKTIFIPSIVNHDQCINELV